MNDIVETPLITPRGQAWEDYVSGESGENNPYVEGSGSHRDYSVEMKRLLGERDENTD